MNDKLQEQAREYANNPQMVTRSLEAAFIAGANSRQAEIDELKKDEQILKKYEK